MIHVFDLGFAGTPWFKELSGYRLRFVRRRLLEDGGGPVEPRNCAIALDGDHSISVPPDNKVEVGISSTGPPVVQVDAVLETAARLELFSSQL